MPANDKQSATMIDQPLHARRVRQVELLISALLRVGVVLSLTIVVLGTTFTFINHPDYLHSHEALGQITGTAAQFPKTITGVAIGVRQGKGRGIVLAGLLLLIATPVMRVAVSIFGFVYEHDRTYVIITTIVLILLLLSFVLGKASG